MESFILDFYKAWRQVLESPIANTLILCSVHIFIILIVTSGPDYLFAHIGHFSLSHLLRRWGSQAMPLESRCWIETASSMLADKGGKNVKDPQGGGREHALSIFLLIWKNRPVFPMSSRNITPKPAIWYGFTCTKGRSGDITELLKPLQILHWARGYLSCPDCTRNWNGLSHILLPRTVAKYHNNIKISKTSANQCNLYFITLPSRLMVPWPPK